MNYKMHYDNLIEKARARVIVKEYKEKHHIIPRCMGGQDDKENLVELTAREHFIAHQLLAKAYPNIDGLQIAAYLMSCRRKIKNRDYSYLKEKFMKSLVGKPKTIEHRNKLSIAHTGKTLSKDHREKISKCQKGKIVSEATKQKMSVSFVIARKELNKDAITCPHCSLSGKPSGMYRWHFDNCKHNPKNNGVLYKGNGTIVICPWCEKEGNSCGMKSTHFDYCKLNPNAKQRKPKSIKNK